MNSVARARNKVWSFRRLLRAHSIGGPFPHFYRAPKIHCTALEGRRRGYCFFGAEDPYKLSIVP